MDKNEVGHIYVRILIYRANHDKAKSKPAYVDIDIDLRIKCSLFDVIVTLASGFFPCCCLIPIEQPAIAYFKFSSDNNSDKGGLDLYEDDNKEKTKNWKSVELFYVFNSLQQKVTFSLFKSILIIGS